MFSFFIALFIVDTPMSFSNNFFSGAAAYFPGFPPFAITPKPFQTVRRSPNNSPGHISVVSSPFLYNNQVKTRQKFIIQKNCEIDKSYLCK